MEEGARFPVGLLLREGGWCLVSCRPCEVAQALDITRGWGFEFGTLAFRRHYPYKPSWKAWRHPKAHILREDLQEVVVITFKPPFNGRGLLRFATKGRKWLTNFPTIWEFNEYWKLSVLWGYPRLEIWANPRQGIYNPKRWTRIGPNLDGMPISQSLWIEHAKRFTQPLAMP